MVYKIDPNYTTHTSFPLKDCFFGIINITPDTDISKYKYSGGYGFAFQKKQTFVTPK